MDSRALRALKRHRASEFLAIAVLLLSGCASTYSTHFRGYANIDDVRLYYEDHGHGYPVLLLHGGTLSGAESWSRTIPAVAADYRVIVPDSRAHGRSTDSEKPLSYDLLTDNIIELMDLLGIEQAHVVGWSDGGVIGLDMALRYPGRLSKLVAYGTNFHYNGLPEHAIEMTRNLSPDTWQPWIADMVYRNIAPDPTQEAVLLSKISDMWLSQPTWTVADLARIRTPVLILEDTLGNAVRPEHTQAMQSAIPGARLKLIDDTDHSAPQVQADTFNRLVLDFLRQ